MNCSEKKKETYELSIARQVLIIIGLLLVFYFMQGFWRQANAEDAGAPVEIEIESDDASLVIMEDPEYFLIDTDEDEPTDWDAYYEAAAGQEIDAAPADDETSVEEPTETVTVMAEVTTDGEYPVITSCGKTNVKLHGVRSKNQLLEYTIPEELMRNDPKFAALMIEAEKYIGFPYVYGESNPKSGFDCSGFVSWVFIHSGVYDTGRRGANGLHSLCSDIEPEDARPGDLVFFQRTMGADVDGITHVGIYVGNNMMIHAGDPVGFADLTEERWIKRFYCFGRLPM